jgi:hypothetical protein
MKTRILFSAFIMFIFTSFVQIKPPNEIVLKFSNDRFTRKISKKLKIFIAVDNYDLEFQRLTDSTYKIPDLTFVSDSLRMDLLQKVHIPVVLRYKDRCFNTYFFNLLGNNNTMDVRIFKNIYDKKGIGLGLTHGRYYTSPPVIRCAEYRKLKEKGCITW